MHTTTRSRIITAVAIAMAFGLQSATQAAMIEIDFAGLDIVYSYDGSGDASIFDAVSLFGGTGDPSASDPLSAVSVEIDSVVQGVLTSDIYADVGLVIPPIPIAGGTVSTPNAAGIFDLLTSSITPGWGLAVDVDDLEVVYSDLGFIQFVFGGAIGTIFDQNFPLLPSGLEIGNPVTVSFAAQVNPNSVTDDGTFITGFTASGAGSYRGNLVPEPSTVFLALAGGCLTLLRRSAWRTRR